MDGQKFGQGFANLTNRTERIETNTTIMERKQHFSFHNTPSSLLQKAKYLSRTHINELARLAKQILQKASEMVQHKE